MSVAASERPLQMAPGRVTPLMGPAVLPLCLTVAGFLLWVLFLGRTDQREIDGLGLISALPPEIIGALGIYTAGFMLAVYQSRIFAPVVLVQLLLWIFMLHGLTAILSPEPVFAVAWRHAGITEYILRNRGLDPTIDAYFSWPGFFGWSALLTKVAGYSSPVSLIRWAPPVFNLLYLAPLVLFFRSATSNRQILWLGLWFFYTTSWVGQDYFSPQAMAYLGYLLIAGIILRWFASTRPATPSWVRRLSLRRRGRARREQPLSLGLSSPEGPAAAVSTRVLSATVLLLVFAAMVPSHQLTPFAILAGITGLVLAKQCTLRGLPVLLAVLLGTWISYMTVHFLQGHLEMAFGPAGLDKAATANIGGRIQGSRQHLIVVYTRMGMTAVVWGLALWGALKARRRIPRYLPYWILAAAPLPLFVLQAYGGEMLLRIYLLTLPACALFMALVFSVESPSLRRRVWTGIGATVAGVLLVTGFLVSRYGNQIIDQVTPGEVEAVAHLYEMAPPGSLLLAGDANLPWKYKQYETYTYKIVTDYNLRFAEQDKIAQSLAAAIKRERDDAFLIITRGQKRTVELLGIPVPAREASVRKQQRPGWLADLERALRSSPQFEIVYENDDASIFVPSSDV